MKKLINRPDRYVDEALGGLCAAYAGVYPELNSGRVIFHTRGSTG
jgi:hypothetical protein